MYVRYAEHNDRDGMLRELKFIGPFGDRAAAQKWIESKGGKPVEWNYNDPNNIGAWATNQDEPLEVFEIVQEIPVEAPEELEWGNEDHAEKWQEIVDKVIEAEKETK